MKKAKRIICFLLCATIVSMIPLSAVATNGELQNSYDIISPQMDYIRSYVTKLNIDGDTAHCNAYINGYPSITTKVTIKMTLEKKGFLGLYWSEVTSWTQTWNNYSGTLAKDYQVSGGTYRVKAIYTAYSGSQSETYTQYSAEVKN